MRGVAGVPRRYREFIGDETKRKWQWQRRNEEELKFWTGIVQAIVGVYPNCSQLELQKQQHEISIN